MPDSFDNVLFDLYRTVKSTQHNVRVTEQAPLLVNVYGCLSDVSATMERSLGNSDSDRRFSHILSFIIDEQLRRNLRQASLVRVTHTKHPITKAFRPVDANSNQFVIQGFDSYASDAIRVTLKLAVKNA